MLHSDCCGKCHRKVEFSPRRELVARNTDIYVIRPYFCPFCRDKGFQVEVYELYDYTKTYGVNQLYDLAEKAGVDERDLENLFKEHKANCLEAAKVEPRNLVEMLTERNEEYRVSRNHDRL